MATDVKQVLYEALGERLGLAVRVSDPAAFKRRAYVERAKDPALQVLSVRTSPNHEDEVWLVHTTGDTNAAKKTGTSD